MLRFIGLGKEEPKDFSTPTLPTLTLATHLDPSVTTNVTKIRRILWEYHHKYKDQSASWWKEAGAQLKAFDEFLTQRQSDVVARKAKPLTRVDIGTHVVDKIAPAFTNTFNWLLGKSGASELREDLEKAGYELYVTKKKENPFAKPKQASSASGAGTSSASLESSSLKSAQSASSTVSAQDSAPSLSKNTPMKRKPLSPIVSFSSSSSSSSSSCDALPQKSELNASSARSSHSSTAAISCSTQTEMSIPHASTPASKHRPSTSQSSSRTATSSFSTSSVPSYASIAFSSTVTTEDLRSVQSSPPSYSELGAVVDSSEALKPPPLDIASAQASGSTPPSKASLATQGGAKQSGGETDMVDVLSEQMKVLQVKLVKLKAQNTAMPTSVLLVSSPGRSDRAASTSNVLPQLENKKKDASSERSASAPDVGSKQSHTPKLEESRGRSPTPKETRAQGRQRRKAAFRNRKKN